MCQTKSGPSVHAIRQNAVRKIVTIHAGPSRWVSCPRYMYRDESAAWVNGLGHCECLWIINSNTGNQIASGWHKNTQPPLKNPLLRFRMCLQLSPQLLRTTLQVFPSREQNFSSLNINDPGRESDRSIPTLVLGVLVSFKTFWFSPAMHAPLIDTCIWHVANLVTAGDRTQKCGRPAMMHLSLQSHLRCIGAIKETLRNHLWQIRCDLEHHQSYDVEEYKKGSSPCNSRL